MDGGFVEGQNVAIEYRWAHGDYARLPALAKELVDRKVSVLVGISSALADAQAAAKTVGVQLKMFNAADEIIE